MALETRVDASRRTVAYTVEIVDSDKEYNTIAKGKVIIDQKDEGRPAGLVEDVWVHEEYRKRGLGKQIMEQLLEIAKSKNAYKVILLCAEHNITFYEKCGFHQHQKGMRYNL